MGVQVPSPAPLMNYKSILMIDFLFDKSFKINEDRNDILVV